MDQLLLPYKLYDRDMWRTYFFHFWQLWALKAGSYCTHRKTVASTNNYTFDNFLTSKSSPMHRLNYGFGNTVCTAGITHVIKFPGPVEIHLLIRVDQGKACWNGLFDEVWFLYQNYAYQLCVILPKGWRF